MLRLRACDTQKRLHPDLSFIDVASFPALEHQSILEEFQSDIGTSAFDSDDLDPLPTPNSVDTGVSTLSSRRGSDAGEVEMQEFVEGSSTGPASADPRKLKQRRNGIPPDLEEGLYSPRMSRHPFHFGVDLLSLIA